MNRHISKASAALVSALVSALAAGTLWGGGAALADYAGDTAWSDIPSVEGVGANHVVAHGVAVTSQDVLISVRVAQLDEPSLIAGSLFVYLDTDASAAGAEWVLHSWRTQVSPFIGAVVDPASDQSHWSPCADLPVRADLANGVITTSTPKRCIGSPDRVRVRVRWGTGDYVGSVPVPSTEGFTPWVATGQSAGVDPVSREPEGQPPLGWSDPADVADPSDDVLGYGVSLEADTVRVSVLLRALTPESYAAGRLDVSVDANGDARPDWLLRSRGGAGTSPTGEALPAAQWVDRSLCTGTPVRANMARRVVTLAVPRRCLDDPAAVAVRLVWVSGADLDADVVPSSQTLSPVVALGQVRGVLPVLTGDEVETSATPTPGPVAQASTPPSVQASVDAVAAPQPSARGEAAPVRTEGVPGLSAGVSSPTSIAPDDVALATPSPRVRSRFVTTATLTTLPPAKADTRAARTRVRIDADAASAGRTVSVRVSVHGRHIVLGVVRLNELGDGSISLRSGAHRRLLTRGTQVFVVWGRSTLAVPRLRIARTAAAPR